jgi:hypothetical protein
MKWEIWMEARLAYPNSFLSSTSIFFELGRICIAFLFTFLLLAFWTSLCYLGVLLGDRFRRWAMIPRVLLSLRVGFLVPESVLGVYAVLLTSCLAEVLLMDDEDERWI